MMGDSTCTSLKLDDFKFEALLDQKFMREDVDLIDAYITLITEAKSIGQVTAKLSKSYSFGVPFQFLKRIARIGDEFRCLIGPTELIDRDKLESNLKELDLNNKIEIIKIPAFKPLTKKQLEFAKQYWPCNFFEYKHVEKCLAGENLFVDEQFVLSNLNRVIELAKRDAKCAAIIANKEKVIVECSSAVDEHFLYHSAFRAVNRAAEEQLKYIKENNRNDIVLEGSKPVILPYLCSTYDVYLTNEPCVMCAMALLHSRIKRLFYLDLDQMASFLTIHTVDCMNDHAITKLQIHTKKGLNHHFEVFKVGLKRCDLS